MTQNLYEITKAAAFDAAHYLTEGADAHPYRRLHGHSFRVEASVRGAATGPAGWVVDLGALEAGLKAAAVELDHSLLNETPGLERPTLESLCAWFAERLRPAYPALSRITVSRPTLGESCTLTLA